MFYSVRTSFSSMTEHLVNAFFSKMFAESALRFQQGMKAR